MPVIKVVNIDALSYVGTTWLNLLLGSHPDVMTLGPPHRFWKLKDSDFKGACLVHGNDCEFWAGFAKTWDRNQNFFESLSEYSGKTIFLMDNAPTEFLEETTKSEAVKVIKGRYLRDARAITASYARKMANQGITYKESIQPNNWFYGSFMAIPSVSQMNTQYEFIIRYEDAVRDQSAALKTLGTVLGIEYDDSAFRFWEADHHITSGNQGPISMIKLHQQLNVGNFESKKVYTAQLEKLKENPTSAFSDERWKTQLTEQDLKDFDVLMGAKNEELGYQRDQVSHSGGRKLWLKTAFKKYFKPSLLWNRKKEAILEPDTEAKQGTEYYTEIDQQKLKSLAPYKVKPSSLSFEDVTYNVNHNFFAAYGPDFKLKDCLALSVDGPLDYQRFLSELKRKIPNLRSNTFAHYLPNRELENDEIACVIRHDVDGDLIAASQQAKIEKSLGYRSSYFILHTAPYYGTFETDGSFLRNEECIRSYKEIQDQGHEIALHTDGMLVYQEYQRDGAQCLVDEIHWLRSNDIDLVGTTAHNSWPSYGVENFTIFQGKDHGKGNGMKAVCHNGKWAPIGTLTEKDLNLTYEANELLWQNSVPLFYAALRSQNVWRISLYNYPSELLSKEYSFGKLSDFNNKFVSTDELLDLAETIISPAYLYLVVHPMHYGLRTDNNHKPWLPEESVSSTTGDMSCWSGFNENESLRVSAISVLNELGTPDRGIDCYNSSDQKVLTLGSQNMATTQVSADSKYSQVMSQQLARSSGIHRTGATSFAQDTPTLRSFQEAYKSVIKHGKPDYLIVSLNSGNKELSSILEWSTTLSDVSKKTVILIEDVERSEFENTSKIDPELVKKVDFFVPDVFAKYKGAAPLFRAGNKTIWAPQGHFLVGREINKLIN